MPTKIRLQRRGKKKQAFYHIVIADGRAPRDGKYIENIGTYNPLTNPADIKLEFDRALYWLQTGAQPTDTVKAIFSHEGVMLKYHLLKGVKKGALSDEQAEAKFQTWLKEKQEKIANKVKNNVLSEKDDKKKRLEAERKVNEERAKALAAKKAAELGLEQKAKDEAAAEKATENAEGETKEAVEAKEEVKEEAPKTEAKEEVKEEKKEEAPKAEAKEEEVKEEKKEEAPKAEAKEEVKEEKKEEAPAEEEKKEEKKGE